MVDYIKFAGLALNWQIDYARQYAQKLFEMGFVAKVLILQDCCVVAYAHKPFMGKDAEEVYAAIKNEGIFKNSLEESVAPILL